MTTGTAKRCSMCNAPMLSAFEKEQGTCTACLRLIMTSEPASGETTTIKRKPQPQEVYQEVREVYPQGQANSVQMGCKVSSETHAKAQAIIKRNAQTQSGWLRGLIEREVYRD